MPEIANPNVDAPLLWEQVRNVAGGMDAFSDPAELDANACQTLVNILIRDKRKARTRPGADALGFSLGVATLIGDDGAPLLADDGPELLPDSSAAPAATGPVMGLFYYDTPNFEQLIAMSNTSFNYWNGATWVSMPGFTPADAPIALEQGVDTVLVSDGTNQMQIWNGVTWSGNLGATSNDPPVEATILCWHSGRMFASGKASLPDTIWVSNRLAFGTGDWNATTRSFRIGMGEGSPVRALKSFQGFTLAVGKETSIWLVDTDPANEPADWTAETLGESVSFGAGVCGPLAWDVYGNDIFFVSPDLQIRTLRRMAAAQGQYELSAPLSEPMQPYIDRINEDAQRTICVRKYQELILFAVPLDSATTPDHVLVYNGRLGKWIGVWTGWTPTAWAITRFAGRSRLVFGDSAGYVNQWKDKSSATNDDTYLDNGEPIACELDTRNLIFGDVEADKVAFNARLRFNAGNALMTVTAVGDEADLKTFSQQMQGSGDVLGTGTLPFLLQSVGPTIITSSLRGLPSFREMFLKLASATGWWELRNLSVSARPRPMKNK